MLGVLAALPLLSVAADEDPSWAVSFDPPAAVASAWVDASRSFDAVDRCDETSRELGLETRHADIVSRYYAALQRAKGIWGNTISGDVALAPPAGEPVACGRANILQAMDEAELALDNEDRAFAEATVGMARGAWVGPLKLCRDTVLSAVQGSEAFSGQPLVLVKFQPDFAMALSSISERAINGPLAIRMDGEVISEPTVVERIDGGQFQVTGPDLPYLERLSDAVGGQC